MAVSSISFPGARGATLECDDYSLYSALSEEDMIEMAIEQSLADAHASSAVLNRLSSAIRRPTPSVQQNVAPPANPPSEVHVKTMEGATKSSYYNYNGQLMMAWRRYDGTLVNPEPAEEVEPMLKAIWNGDLRTVREIVKSNPNRLLEPNKEGWIALHEAAYYDQQECLDIMLRHFPETINKRTLKDQTALLLATARESVPCVRYLLKKGADPDIANKDRETPLFKACERENPEIVSLILKFGGSVNKTCIQGWTALHEAVCRDNVEICELLVRAGAKVSIPNMYGITPLFVAAQSGRVDALHFLIKNGADVNSQATDGATALYEACKNGHEETVRLLLSQCADANIPAKAGFLPLHIAAQRGNDSIVSMLIPVTSKARVKRSGISPLHLAAERNKDEVLETLIEAGFDVNAELSPDRSTMYEDRRSTALYFAVSNNNINMVTMLLEAGANPNIDTFNPLLVAVRQGCIQTVTLLIEHGANVNTFIQTHPTSFPATIMFCMKYLSLLKYLLDNGCDALSCFKCVYGSHPHPPIKTTRRNRDDLSYTSDVPVNTKVQFCEMISTPSVSRWAGPIIDVLLDYVGNVQLCARLIEHLDSYEDWAVIKEKSMPPRTLMHLCRIKIREEVGIKRLRKLDTLPIPGRLISFLTHNEHAINV